MIPDYVPSLVEKFEWFFEDWVLEKKAALRAHGLEDDEIDARLALCKRLWPEMRMRLIEDFCKDQIEWLTLLQR